MTTQFLMRNKRLKACGIDLSSVLLGQARRREPVLPLIRGTATSLPFRQNYLSAVVCECVLSLVEDTAQAWREIHRVLVCGGYLAVTDVYARSPENVRPLQSVFATCCLKGARSREELVSRLDETGFDLLVWEDHSRDLKRLAAQLAFAGWPWQTFWQGPGAGFTEADARAAIRQTRPGYFLMIARKRGKA
jgi:ubiquinone/menaquinone biosynthesis C-methylase UbiE